MYFTICSFFVDIVKKRDNIACAKNVLYVKYFLRIKTFLFFNFYTMALNSSTTLEDCEACPGYSASGSICSSGPEVRQLKNKAESLIKQYSSGPDRERLLKLIQKIDGCQASVNSKINDVLNNISFDI